MSSLASAHARMLKLLVVDDEPDICSLISDALVDEGHEVTCAADGSQALELACATPFDVVVADMRLPGLDGLALFRRLREESPATDMILITGNAAVADAVAVLKEGAFDYLTKPIHLEELVIQLNRIASFRALRRDIVEARAELKRASVLDQLIGHSPEMLVGREADRDRRQLRRRGAHSGRERDGEGAGGARPSRGERTTGQALRGRQLRRLSRHAHRGRAVRA